MTNRRQKWIRGLAGGLALLAALAVSAFPSGLMLKVAGRCGRQLCNCQPDSYADVCKTCKTSPASGTPAKNGLALVNSTISDSDAPGMAFQEIFSGVVAPHGFALPVTSLAVEISTPAGHAFSLSCAASELSTPPPRA